MGLISFKFENVYYAFYNDTNSEYQNLGKKLVTELKSMSPKDYIILKNLIKKLPQDNKNSPWYKPEFDGILNVLNNPTKFCQQMPELDPTDGYSFYGRVISYVYIIDLDQHQFNIKHIDYTCNGYTSNGYYEEFPEIIKADIQTFCLNNISEFWT